MKKKTKKWLLPAAVGAAAVAVFAFMGKKANAAPPVPPGPVPPGPNPNPSSNPNSNPSLRPTLFTMGFGERTANGGDAGTEISNMIAAFQAVHPGLQVDGVAGTNTQIVIAAEATRAWRVNDGRPGLTLQQAQTALEQKRQREALV